MSAPERGQRAARQHAREMQLRRRRVIKIGWRSKVFTERVLRRFDRLCTVRLALDNGRDISGEQWTIAGTEERQPHVGELPATDLRVGGDADDRVVTDAARELEERRAVAGSDRGQFAGDEHLSGLKVRRVDPLEELARRYAPLAVAA